ncbi:MAG: hypothetical protein AB1529_05700 [Candidatus Micrarchaeota archaeon]
MKKKLMGLTTELEMYDDPMRYEVVVDAASQLRTLLREEELSLTMGEKLRVLKSVTKAKVRAFMGGPSDNYRTFKTLDAISGDLVQLL